MNLDFKFYFAVFLRRIHYFILISALVSAAAIAAAFLLPAVYHSQTTLLVEAPQIPNQLAAPTVQLAAMEQLQVIESRLMTRTNLLDIAKRLKVFRDIDSMTPDDIVQRMRDNSAIQKRAGLNQATVMVLEFSAERAETTAAVLNEYVTLILRENVAIRTERAGQTLEFFEQEVDRLGAELDAQSSKILEFQNANKDALPATLQFRLNQQTALQQQVQAADRSIETLEDQKKRLIAVFNATGQVNNTPTAQMTPEAQQLAQARDQLAQAMAVFSANNPKVKMLEARVAQLEGVVRAQLPSTSPTPTTNPAQSMLDIQIADIDAQIAALKTQRDTQNKQLDVLTKSIDRTAGNQITLDALNRDYANIQGQYNGAVQRLSQAATGERIELTAKGERITVVDAATVPNRPMKPNRLLIAGGGIAAGIGLGIAAIVLRELLNRSVRRPKDLISAFGITPITTIPYMRTPGETYARRAMFATMLMIAVIGIPALIYAVHMYYQPLDLILAKVAAKLGMNL